LEQDGSHPQFLVLPGSRPVWAYRGLYPIANVAYRRAPALAAGGFDERLAADGRPSPLHWDSELAYRLQRLGWRGRYLTDPFLIRRYRPPARLAWLAEEWRLATELPPALARAPELSRRLPHAGVFAGVETLTFDLLLLGVAGALVGRRRLWLALALPWLNHIVGYFDLWPPGRWLPSSRLIASLLLRQFIWCAGLIRGSLRARRLVV
jgi:hypothetical protein